MGSPGANPPLMLRLDGLSDEDLEALERVLLKARAGELSEVRRRDVRLTAGYGDPTNRAVMDGEAKRARLAYDVLTSLVEALRAARSG